MSNTVVDPFGRFRFPRRRIGQTGFTLLEVLIVVGIIALLATILLTVVTKARDSGRRVSCLNNLQSIARAIIMYTSDNEGAFPMAAATMASNPMANRTPGHQYEDWVYWQSTQDPLNPPHLFIDSINSGGIGKYLSGLDDRSIGGLALLRCPSDASLANKGFL